MPKKSTSKSAAKKAAPAHETAPAKAATKSSAEKSVPDNVKVSTTPPLTGKATASAPSVMPEPATGKDRIKPLSDAGTLPPQVKQTPGGVRNTQEAAEEARQTVEIQKITHTPFEHDEEAAKKALDTPDEATMRRETEAIANEPESINADPEPEHTGHDEGGRPLHQIFMREGIPPMSIVHITPELSPVAKVGGLADVVYGLARELEIRGNHVEIILPKYDCMRYDHIWGLTRTFNDLWVPWCGGAIHCSVDFGFVHGRKVFFIEPHSGDNFFNRGCFYGNRDDVLRFAFFSRAAVEFLLKSGKRPDIIHCHDWQTGLVPVYLFEIYQHIGLHHSRVCYTIHNFRHQGICGHDVCDITGLGRRHHFCRHERLLDNHNSTALNLMKGGVVYSNFVTTVSPRHAGEAKDHGQGFGLEPTLHTHGMKFGGVLNGIDYDVWNPETDSNIPAHYSASNIQPKYDNKRALRERLWLADNEKPIVAFIGRLDPQKGLDLVRHALFYCINHGAQFVLLGSSPDRGINDYFWQLKHYLNNNEDSHIEVGFNGELAHLIYAGADMMIVPSRFEPCGLTQLIAMRYGTVPIVRSVGGLADTVFDKDFTDKPFEARNGYVFHNDDNQGVESALCRAISCYYQFPDHFRILMENGMRQDCSWNVPGQHYLNIYDHIRAK